tara:strand:- start:21903 stop:23048 length:1146 start_codon:yes stop_codon:yes gene_type:complete
MARLDILTLSKWLSYYNSPHITFSKFKKVAKVYTVEGVVSIESYRQKAYGKVPTNVLKMLYTIIVTNKKDYLVNFYNNNLKIPDDLSMDNLELVSNNNKHPKFKRLVRNLYYEDILSSTEDLKKRSYMNVIIDLFKYRIIDRNLLAPSVLKLLSEGKVGSLLSGMYFRASVMSPFLVYSISHILGSPKKVLTPCLGWSSYLIGFMENMALEQYVGIDVIKKVCRTSLQLAKEMRPDVVCQMYCRPSEDMYNDKAFMNRYKNNFDAVFFCPPYYQLELYHGSNQSTERYKSYDEWLRGYWISTVKLCYYCLRRGGQLCYIISGYKNSSGKYLDLDADMNEVILDNKFVLMSSIPMGRNVKFTNHDSNKQSQYNETIYIFKKI